MMKRKYFLVSFIIFLFFSVNIDAQAETDYSVWVKNSLSKIKKREGFQFHPLSNNLIAEVKAAKNEYEAIQLVLRSKSQELKDIKILVSGGIDEYKIRELNPYVDAYGIGTSISNAPVMDFALDIVEIEGKPLAKRGKLSGKKMLFRCSQCLRRKIVPWGTKEVLCDCGNKMENILIPIVKNGKLIASLPKVGESRNYVLEQMKHFKIDRG